MLTHIQIASAKPSAKPFNLSDSQGLFLTVRPNGSKLWRLSYRYLGRVNRRPNGTPDRRAKGTP
ncbi:MAG: Arm DNA-binding domain-containing protein, partial [Pseudomonadota bacterium]|uniref:Arm DNA-binding domain-containing protein n=1 Tax=Sphingobium sp. TaxID=1912891 RepID=UPI002E212F61